MSGSRDADILQRLARVEEKLESMDDDMHSLKEEFRKFKDEELRPILDWIEQQKGAGKVKTGIRYTLTAIAGTVLGWILKVFSGGS